MWEGALHRSRSPPLHSLPGLRPPHPRPALRIVGGPSGCRVWSPQVWKHRWSGETRLRGLRGETAREDAAGVRKTQHGKMETGPGWEAGWREEDLGRKGGEQRRAERTWGSGGRRDGEEEGAAMEW